jgi:hypothetical protein
MVMDLFSEKWNFWFGQLKNRANVRKGIGIVEICIAGKKKARTFVRAPNFFNSKNNTYTR